MPRLVFGERVIPARIRDLSGKALLLTREGEVHGPVLHQSDATKMEERKRKTKRKRAMDLLVYFAVRLLLCVIQALPEVACLRLADVLGWMFSDVLRFRAQVIDENLQFAFPDLNLKQRRRIGRAMWRHLMLLVCEIAIARRKIHETNWREFVNIKNERQLLQCQITDRAVIIVTSHFGNFEISGYVAGLLGMPNFTVARPLDNSYLHDFMVRFRECTGQFIIGSRGSSKEVTNVIQSGHTLAVLGDHYGGPKGCWVDFMGRPASCHKSIALLALSHDVPIAVFNTRRKDRMLRFEMTVDPELIDPQLEDATVTTITQRFTDKIERTVREYPEQYWWLHRRWKDTRRNHRKRRLSKRHTRLDEEAVPKLESRTPSKSGGGATCDGGVLKTRK